MGTTVLSWFVGLAFAAAGVAKVAGARWALDRYRAAGRPDVVFYGSGVIELAGGLALLVRASRFAAVMVLLVMIVIVTLWQPRRRSLRVQWQGSGAGARLVVAQLVLPALLVVIGWLSRP